MYAAAILLLGAATSSVIAYPANTNPTRADISPSPPPLARGLPIQNSVADTLPWTPTIKIGPHITTVKDFVTDPVDPQPWTVEPLITPAPNPVTDPIEFKPIATRFDPEDLEKFKDKFKIPVADPPKPFKKNNGRRWDCDNMPMLPRPDDGNDGTLVKKCDPTPWDGPDGPDTDGLVVKRGEAAI